MKVLVIADIHGNAEALRNVLDREGDADTTLFLGDAVSPGPQPNETLALLEQVSGTFIRGNHDEEMLEPERIAGWPAPWLALYEWVLETVEPSGYDFIRSFEHDHDRQVGDVSLRLTHGELSEHPRNALPDTADERLTELKGDGASPVVLFGHSHVQFRRIVDGTEYINPGSVGQNRCGHCIACYGVIEDGVFEHREIAYDPRPVLDAVDRIPTLDAHPDFRGWLKDGFESGWGIGRNEPWTRFAAEGYR